MREEGKRWQQESDTLCNHRRVWYACSFFTFVYLTFDTVLSLLHALASIAILTR